MKRLIQRFLTIVLFFTLCGCGNGNVVGKGIKKEDINEFYYTISTSTYPPEYQRYYFYVEDGKPYFFHETREGYTFPLTEEDTTISGTIGLTDEEWDYFYHCLEGGSVKKRHEDANAGGSGPYLYLIWKKDHGKIQEFTFLNADDEINFENYCKELIEKGNTHDL